MQKPDQVKKEAGGTKCRGRSASKGAHRASVSEGGEGQPRKQIPGRHGDGQLGPFHSRDSLQLNVRNLRVHGQGIKCKARPLGK